MIRGEVEKDVVRAALLLAMVLNSMGCVDKRWNEVPAKQCATLDDALSSLDAKYPEAKSTPDRHAAVRKKCESDVAEAIKPCQSEYKFGTDSAEQCIARRIVPIFSAATDDFAKDFAAAEVKRQQAGETKEFNDAFKKAFEESQKRLQQQH